METITETTEFWSGEDLWDWLVWSNPIVATVLEELKLTADEEAIVRQTLGSLVRERANGDGPALLSNPVNIGIGAK